MLRASLHTFTFLLAISSCHCLMAQPDRCCRHATQVFANFGSDTAFVNSHYLPSDYQHRSAIGQEITLPTSDGKPAHAYWLASASASRHWIFVFHEWWGLNEHIKREAERLYQDLGGQVHVLALDLYDKRVAETREQASQYMQSVEEQRARVIIQAAVRYAGKRASIATIGWCFGGGWSMQASLQIGKQAKACVIYYGMPETNVQRLRQLHAPVLGIFAQQDRWISPEVVTVFERAMQQAGKKLIVLSYDADHAFANPSHAGYRSALAEEAHQQVVLFLRRYLL